MYVVYQLWEILKTCLKSILYIFYIFVTRCASFCHSKFWICGMYMVKVTFVQALRLCTGRTAHRGSRGIAILFHDHSTRRGWVVSITPRPLFTPGKDPVFIVQEVGCATGPVWTGAENLAPTGIRSPVCPACSQSLYQLSYTAHSFNIEHGETSLIAHYYYEQEKITEE